MLTVRELNQIQGTLNYLNQYKPSADWLAAQPMTFVDSNGDDVAVVMWDNAAGEYVLSSVPVR